MSQTHTEQSTVDFDRTAQTIFDERFASNAIPANWHTDTTTPIYGKGAWDCRKGDGVFAMFPHDEWQVLRAEVELEQIGSNATAFCGLDSRSALSIDLGNRSNSRHSASDGGYSICLSDVEVPITDRTTKLVFEWTSDTMRVMSGDVELICAPNLRRNARAGTFQTGFRDCIVRRFHASGVAQEGAPNETRANPQPLQTTYPLDVTVDFNDDLMAAAWTHKTFENLCSEWKSWGVKRVSWIDLGRAEDDYFAGIPYTKDHATRTVENVGDVFQTACDHAHRAGMELIGVFKPYDMAIHGWTDPPFSPEAKMRGRIERIGGTQSWATRMAQNNQHLITCRKPGVDGPAKNQTWTRIDLVKDDEAATGFSIDDIEIFVSDDNDRFRPYSGAIKRVETVEDYPLYHTTPSGAQPNGESRRARVFRLDNLEIREPFMALRLQSGGRTFQNRLCDLVHVFGKNGEETHLTYGLSPRRTDRVSLVENKDSDGKIVDLQGGFEYNRAPGSPSSYMSSGGDALNSWTALDRSATSYLALARGKDKGPLAVLSPCFEETRALWMKWIVAMLDSGADGIDIRPGHHHSDFAWIEYGFETPVRDEMLRRTGVDIWKTDDFDRELWSRIRGEGWTQFVREVSQVVRARGKKMIAHIDGHFDNAPGLGGAMNVITNWRTWLEEDLLDGVTGKSLWPRSSFALEVLHLAHSKGVPVSYTPYCNNFFEQRNNMNHMGDSPVGCEVPVDRLISLGRGTGYDSFGFYENASAIWAAEDETVDFRPNATPLRTVLQKHFTN